MLTTPVSCSLFFRRPLACAVALLAVLGLYGPAMAQDDGGALLGNVDDLQLEDLANIKVTSVSRHSELLSDAPSSIFVITGDDIRRAGALTLPEALRLAPNLQVARVDARNYAVTARGFNNPFENKLLVLIDGRIVYSPLFSGVYWDAQDLPLSDIDRIEVISGPGGTMWGANAVNGVINVITKRADQTQGTLVSAAGSRDEADGAVRYGGLAAGGSYRVYAKSARQDDLQRTTGKPDDFGLHRSQAGFRADWGKALEQTTLQGDAYHGDLHQAGTRDIEIGGANLLGRMTRQTAGGSEWSVQAYWDYTERNQPNAFVEHLNTIDLQLQQTSQIGMNNLMWGAGYREAYDRTGIAGSSNFAFLPGSLHMSWANLFAQDEVALSDTLRMTAGLKAERNSYTGMELLPTLRFAWKVTPERMAWAAVSRAVRAPSRIDRDFYSPVAPRIVNGVPHYVIGGGPEFDSESARDAEIGYRAQAGALSYSTTVFITRYSGLRTGQVGSDGVIRFENGGYGLSRGVEAWVTWQPLPSWRLSAGGVAQRIDTGYNPGVSDVFSKTGLAPSDPSSHWMLRSSLDLGSGNDLDLTVQHSGAIASTNVASYTTLNARYGWRIGRNLDLSLIGQNLIGPAHAEYGSAANRDVLDRTLAVKLVWSH